MKRLMLAALILGAFACSVGYWSQSRFRSIEDGYSAPLYTQSLPAGFESYVATANTIRPLYERKKPIQPGDWLERFPEGGQTFADYVLARDAKPLRAEFSTIYVQPLGDFDEIQTRIVVQTAAFLGLYFGTQVEILSAQPLGEVPNHAHRTWNDIDQVLSTWITNDRLKPERPDDAIAVIGLVTCDLWVEQMNYVFGSASLVDRVGVWSLFRNGDPHEGEPSYRLCLKRTIKTAAHETGHMLGIPHCREYECCMNGSRSRDESDRRPIECCPACQPKLWWTCGVDAHKRSRGLTDFAARNRMTEEAKFWNRQSEFLKP